MKKTLLTMLLALLLGTVIYAEPVYKYVETEPVTQNVTLTKVEEFHSDHNISYSYIKMDLTDKRVRLELLKSENGTDIMDNVKNLASQNENTVAALNGDFFSVFSGNKGFSLGIEKKDGVVLQSPVYPETMATVAYDGESVLMDYLSFHVMAVAPNWEYEEIRHINKHTTYFGDILMYTSSFNNGFSPAPGGNVVEVVVEDSKIVEFRRNMEPCKIPENGCVLVVSEGSSMFFANNFAVGDEIKFDWYVTPSLDDFDMAFGGGSMLVKEGQDVGKIGDYTHTVAGFHPRSAIGIDKDGKYLYLVAVDGRQTSSRGMRMSHLAELMIELGCYYAVNLDGGGSTNLVASTLWNDELHAVNKPTENRRVINAVGIVLDSLKDDVSDEEESKVEESEETEDEINSEPIPFGIKIKSDKCVVYKGQKIEFTAVVHDDNLRPLFVENNEIEWYCSEGKIDNGTFVSDVGGEITVGVSFEDLYAEASVFVVDEISGIITDSILSISKGNSEKISISVFDVFGHVVDVTDFHDFVITSSDDNVASVMNGVVTAKKNGIATVTVSDGAVSSDICIVVGTKPVEYTYGFENENGYFASYPNETKGNFEILDEVAFSGKFSGALHYDFTEENDKESSETQASEDLKDVEDVSRAVYFVLSNDASIHDDCNTISIMALPEKEFAHEIRLQITDGNGSAKYLKYDGEIAENEWNKLEFEIPRDIKRPAKLSRVYVLYTPGEEKDNGTVYLDDLKFETSVDYEVKKGIQNNCIRSLNNANVTSSVRITVLPDETDNPISLFHSFNAENETIRNNGFAVGSKLKTSVFEDDNALYVFVDTSKGGIRNSGASQWDTIVNAVKSTDKDNLVLVSNESIFGQDDFENTVIKDYLSSIDKNVFAVSRGKSASYMNDKGVSYLTLDSNPETSILLSEEKRQNSVVFSFGEKVTFEFESI